MKSQVLGRIGVIPFGHLGSYNVFGVSDTVPLDAFHSFVISGYMIAWDMIQSFAKFYCTIAFVSKLRTDLMPYPLKVINF